MKRFAERYPEARHPYRGYLAKCANCGLVVVHAHSTDEPLSMHARSKLCAELGKKRRLQQKEEKKVKHG